MASEDDLRTLPEGSTVVIRSHGVGKKVYDQLEECGLSYVDVTCPFVLKIHRIVEKGEQGRRPYCDHWRSGSSGGCGNLRLVHRILTL